MTAQPRRIGSILLIVFGLLLIPLIAMQFTAEVDWSIGDFIVGGALLFAAGLILDFVIRRPTLRKHRITWSLVVILFLVLTWMELAVGIFD